MEGLRKHGGRKHGYQRLPASALQGQEQESATRPNACGCRATSSPGSAALEDEHTLLLEALPFRLALGVGASSSTVNISRSLLCMDLVSDSKALPLWAGLNTWLPNDRELTRFTIKYTLLCSDPGGIHPNRSNSLPIQSLKKVYAEKDVLILRALHEGDSKAPDYVI